MKSGIRLFIYFIIISAVALSGASCSIPKKQISDSDKILAEAESDINDSNYIAAETSLKKLLENEPENVRAKVILASLYVHRAGIRIENHIHLEEVINTYPEESQTYIEKSLISTISENSDKNLKDLAKVLLQLNQVLIQMQTWKEKIKKLPDLNETQARDMRHALTILNELSAKALSSNTNMQPLKSNKTITRGMILYRSVIKIYYFKYLWNQGFFLPINQKMICSLSLNTLQTQILYLKSYMQDLLTDFAIGLPSSAESTNHLLSSFNASSEQVLSWLSTIDPQTKTLADILISETESGSAQCHF
ncbi:MAG: hypothetical protein KDD45_09970 [Bdellovibrionales bacterium]|nr:hypothetical protein [Bdellovibrionales bacterium]